MPRGRRDTHIRKVKPRSSRTPSRRAGDAVPFPHFPRTVKDKTGFLAKFVSTDGKARTEFTDRQVARKRKELPLIEGLEITTLAAEGKAMGRYNDMVVFVPLTVPGDVVDVQIRNRRRRFMEGTVVRYIEKSPLRAEPFCEHFGVCGGCKWQNLPYPEQLRFKEEQVRDQLTRIGKVELPPLSPIIGSARTTHYRNKLEFTFAPRRWMTYEEIAAAGDIDADAALGFHIPGRFDKVLDIRECWLQRPPRTKSGWKRNASAGNTATAPTTSANTAA